MIPLKNVSCPRPQPFFEGIWVLCATSLLAVPFRSFTQPFIVMAAIPFGVIGAVFGHLIMGYNLSLMSMSGVVGLAVVVVNDFLVLSTYE